MALLAAAAGALGWMTLAAPSAQEDGFIKLTPRPFRLGEELRVLDGAFTGTLGMFEGMTDNERVTVLLDLLGRRCASASTRIRFAAA